MDTKITTELLLELVKLHHELRAAAYRRLTSTLSAASKLGISESQWTLCISAVLTMTGREVEKRVAASSESALCDQFESAIECIAKAVKTVEPALRKTRN